MLVLYNARVTTFLLPFYDFNTLTLKPNKFSQKYSLDTSEISNKRILVTSCILDLKQNKEINQALPCNLYLKNKGWHPQTQNAYAYNVCRTEHWIERPYKLQKSSLPRRHTPRPEWKREINKKPKFYIL